MLSRTAATSAIQLAGLTIDYLGRQGRLRAVEDVSIDIGPGEFVAVLGPSGCGKSTILRALAGLIPATAGSIRIVDQPVTGPRRDVGVVFQDATLLPWMTAIQNLRLPGRIMKLDAAWCEDRARALLRLVGLENFADYYPAQLSGGMRQRVGIARGLLHDPAVLLMDEPFGALDAMTREQMNMELQRIWSATGKTILFITHSILEAVFLADRVVVLSARPGRVVDIVTSGMPRPRRSQDMAAPGFVSVCERLRRLFQLQGRID